MKSTIFKLVRTFGLTAASLTFSVHLQAATFTDHFTSGASPLWRNELGAWSAEGGVYKATAPANFPAASTSLPFNLEDFSVDFDVNDVQDGGIWLRSTAEPGTAVGRKGVIFNLQTINGTKVYWHIVNDGNEWGGAKNLVFLPYGNNVHVHIEVSGNTYSAFLNGSSTPASRITTSRFTRGHVALYDFSGQSFDNFVLSVAFRPVATEDHDRPHGSSRHFENPSPARAAVSQASNKLSPSITLEQPTLSIQSGVVLSWPAGFTGYVLEQNTNPAEANWELVTNPVSVVNQVTVPAPSGNRFFRLRAP